MITDDDSDSFDEAPESVPAKLKPSKGSYEDGADEEEEEVQEEGSEEGSDDDSELSVDEYVVEAILAHDFGTKGAVLYQVKWKDYDKEEDLTWEPEGNL